MNVTRFFLSSVLLVSFTLLLSMDTEGIRSPMHSDEKTSKSARSDWLDAIDEQDLKDLMNATPIDPKDLEDWVEGFVLGGYSACMQSDFESRQCSSSSDSKEREGCPSPLDVTGVNIDFVDEKGR